MPRLMVSILLEELGNKEAVEMATRYLAFTWFAFNAERDASVTLWLSAKWLEESGSETVMVAHCGRWEPYWAVRTQPH